MRLIFALALLLPAGCTSEPPRPQPDIQVEELGKPTAETSPVGATQVGTLAGEWRVAGIDGEPFNESYGLALSADEEEIWWDPRCAGMVRSYRIEGTRIAVASPETPAPGAPVAGGPPAPAPAVCTIGLPPRLTDVMRALDSATQVQRTPANGIELSGGGHSLTIFSQ